jgi:hypothetical protein
VSWRIVNSVANPWGEISLTAGGRNLTPQVEDYMNRLMAVAAERGCISRRHHYVPQSYLRAWSNDGKRVRVLDTRRGTDTLRGVRDICVKENFYRVTNSANVVHNQVEAMLGVIDDEAARLRHMLVHWETGQDISFGDFMSLALVLTFQRNRTPQVRRHIDERNAWLAARASQPPMGSLANDTYVDLLFRSRYDAADQLLVRQLEIWDDPQSRFITCDNPVLLSVDDASSPPSMDESEYVWWPISPSRCVAFGRALRGVRAHHRILSPADVNIVRRAVVRSAEEVIVACPGDLDLPLRKILSRRPQVQIDCQPIDTGKGECRIRFATGYGNAMIDNACRPLCALRRSDR